MNYGLKNTLTQEENGEFWIFYKESLENSTKKDYVWSAE